MSSEAEVNPTEKRHIPIKKNTIQGIIQYCSCTVGLVFIFYPPCIHHWCSWISSFSARREKNEVLDLFTLHEGLHICHDIIDLHADVFLSDFVSYPVIVGFSIYMSVSLLANIVLD